MMDKPEQITLEEWDSRYSLLKKQGLCESSWGGPLSRHLADGNRRLLKLRYDNSPAALDLWNFLLSEEDRLAGYRSDGKKIVGAMKDLGTVPVMAFSFDNLVAFYPDGAWWIPCMTELSAELLHAADRLGIDESFCPVRAMLGAFVTKEHFPIPDMLICSAGAVCDDFSAISQRLEHLGHKIHWWEIPHRRKPQAGEQAVMLPGGFIAPSCQVEFVKSQLEIVKTALEGLAGDKLDDTKLSAGIEKANHIRLLLAEIRFLAYTSEPCPMGALEMLIAEMLAIHFCSDRDLAAVVLENILAEIKRRTEQKLGVLEADSPKVFWVNPVADLRMMNLLEGCGARLAGTEYLFSHALDPILQLPSPMEALACSALADPMVGSSLDRADRIIGDIKKFGAEGVIISRIPGASHCATEGKIIGGLIGKNLGLPVIEIEVPPLADALTPGIATRIQALTETIRNRRKR